MLDDRESPQEAAWWSHPLAREIAVVLAVKVVLLYLLWWCFFDLPADKQIGAADVTTFITGSPVAAGREPKRTHDD